MWWTVHTWWGTGGWPSKVTTPPPELGQTSLCFEPWTDFWFLLNIMIQQSTPSQPKLPQKFNFSFNTLKIFFVPDRKWNIWSPLMVTSISDISWFYANNTATKIRIRSQCLIVRVIGESSHLSQASSSPFKFKRYCAHVGPLTILSDIPAIASPRPHAPYPISCFILNPQYYYHLSFSLSIFLSGSCLCPLTWI